MTEPPRVEQGGPIIMRILAKFSVESPKVLLRSAHGHTSEMDFKVRTMQFGLNTKAGSVSDHHETKQSHSTTYCNPKAG